MYPINEDFDDEVVKDFVLDETVLEFQGVDGAEDEEIVIDTSGVDSAIVDYAGAVRKRIADYDAEMAARPPRVVHGRRKTVVPVPPVVVNPNLRVWELSGSGTPANNVQGFSWSSGGTNWTVDGVNVLTPRPGRISADTDTSLGYTSMRSYSGKPNFLSFTTTTTLGQNLVLAFTAGVVQVVSVRLASVNYDNGTYSITAQGSVGEQLFSTTIGLDVGTPSNISFPSWIGVASLYIQVVTPGVLNAGNDGSTDDRILVSDLNLIVP